MLIRKRYIRFVVGKRSKEAMWLTGVVAIAQLKKGRFTKKDRQIVNGTFKWFNDNITCPPYTQKRNTGVWSVDAVAWFRTTARQPIARLRPLIHILRKHGCVIRTIYANNPGKIVYRDKWQVVAETPN